MAPLGTLIKRVKIAIIHGQHGVFEQGQGGQELEKLEDHPHVLATPQGALALAHAVDMLVANHHIPCGRAVDAGDHVQQGRFAAAGFPDDRNKLPIIQLQVDGFERDEFAGSVFVDLFHIAQNDGRGLRHPV